MKRIFAILLAALCILPAAQAAPNDLACGLYANLKDRPFLFAVIENSTRTLLFLGRPENPAAN